MNECANILQVVDSRRVDKLKGNEGRRVAIELPGKLSFLTSVCYKVQTLTCISCGGLGLSGKRRG